MPKPTAKTRKPVRTTKLQTRAAEKTSRRAVLSLIVRYDNPGQLTVPDQLSLGDDGKLYLTRSGESEDSKVKPQPVSLKDSVAWFRVGNDCHLRMIQGGSFGEWLKRIEQALL